MMKKIVVFSLLVLSLFLIVGCSDPNDGGDEEFFDSVDEMSDEELDAAVEGSESEEGAALAGQATKYSKIEFLSCKEVDEGISVSYSYTGYSAKKRVLADKCYKGSSLNYYCKGDMWAKAIERCELGCDEVTGACKLPESSEGCQEGLCADGLVCVDGTCTEPPTCSWDCGLATNLPFGSEEAVCGTFTNNSELITDCAATCDTPGEELHQCWVTSSYYKTFVCSPEGFWADQSNTFPGGGNNCPVGYSCDPKINVSNWSPCVLTN